MSRPTVRQLSLLLALFFMGLAPLALAQNITGAIDGVVSDASGALVPGAKVVITSLATKEVARSVTTNERGAYSASFLAVGDYSVTISADGFENQAIPLVSVDVGETATTNATLHPGSTAETLTVNASEVAPNVETPENSAVINTTQMNELALNTRNFEQILLIQPGVSYTGPDQLASGLINAQGAANAHSLSVNGLQPTQLAFNFDGADTLSRITIAQSVLFPSVDSVNQIKVLRDSYGAQYGGGGSAQVLTVSKAGGSTFHGDAYFFLRNQYLNANAYFNLISTPIIPRPDTRYNDFGFSIGGPLFFPHFAPRSKAKTFFFYSEEFRRIQLNPTSQQGNYPYLAQANGYFQDPVCLPAGTPGGVSSGLINGVTVKLNGCASGLASPPVTNSPYPGFNWQIPQSAITTTSQQYLKDIIFPALALQQPNSPSSPQSLVLAQKSTTNSDQILVRFDRQFNSRFSAFFRYIIDPYNLQVPDGYNQTSGFPGVNTSNIYTYGENVLAHGTFTATPTTVLDFGYSYLPYAIKSTIVGFASAALSPDIQVQTPYLNTTGRVPTIQINGQKWGPNGPIRTLNHTQQVFENTTRQVGPHTLQFGANYEHYYASTNQGTLNAGVFVFDQAAGGLPGGNNPATGANYTTSFESSFAGFLTGTVDQFTQESIDPTSQIASNLYEAYIQDNWRAKAHLTLQAGMRWSVTGQPYDENGHLGVFQPQSYKVAQAPHTAFADGQACLAGNTDPNCNGSAPNASYNALNGITQGGVNSAYGKAVVRQSYLNFAPRLGFAWDVYGNGKTSLRGGYGVFFNQVANTIAEQQVQGNPAYVRTTTFNAPIAFASPGAGQNSSFIPPTISGSNPQWTTPYTQSYSLDIQQEFGPSFVGTLAYVGNKTFHLQGVEDINQPLPGEWVTAGVAFGSAARGANAAKAALLNPIRPYLGYEGINYYDTRYFADYNGLQVGVVKSFTKARGAHLVANYTWSKAMANSQGFSSGPQNTYDLSSEWGPTNSDRRNIFNVSLAYLLPFYREQHGFTGKLLGGYEVAAIITAVSGTNLTPTFTQSDPAGQGWISNVTDSVTRPDQAADPNQNAPHQVGQYFVPGDFSFVPAGQARPGNAQVGSIHGPGYQVWNVSLYRNIELPEKFRFQFRVEAFNLFNHVNFDNLNTSYNSTLFGEITTARDNRQLQLGAKLYF